MADPAYQRQEVFRFLDLPAELRNRIYGYAIKAPPGPVTLKYGQDHSRGRMMWTGLVFVYQARSEVTVAPKKVDYRLLLTCKQVHSEAKGLIYEQTVLVFERLPAVAQFIKDSGAAAHITEVRVKYEPSELDRTQDAAAAAFALLPRLQRLVLGLKSYNNHRTRYIYEGFGRRIATVIRPFLDRAEDAAERRKILEKRVEIRAERQICAKPPAFSQVQPWDAHDYAGWTLRFVAGELEKAGVLAAVQAA